MTTGEVHLIIKDPSKGMQTGNFRPITCLPNMSKPMTGILSQSGAIYDHLISQSLFSDEHKGYCSISGGCKEQLLIANSSLKTAKGERPTFTWFTSIARRLITYGSIPHSWILEYLLLCNVEPQVISHSLKQPPSEFSPYIPKQRKSGKCQHPSRYFQGDSVSPLQFIISLIPLSVHLRGTAAG